MDDCPAETEIVKKSASSLRQSCCRLLGLVAILGLVVVVVVIFRTHSGSSADELLAEARAALARGHHNQAEHLALRVLAESPGSNAALIIAGRAATELQHVEDAAHYYGQIDDDGGGSELVAAHCEAGELCLKHGSLKQAEDHFRRALRLDEHSVRANEQLAYLLRLTCRYWDARPSEMELLRQDQVNIHALLALGSSASIAPTETVVAWLKEGRAKDPNDAMPLLGLARDAVFKNKRQRALELLRIAVELEPNFVEAQVQLGRILIDSGSNDEVHRWNAGLPARADEHPGIWLVRGLWARRRQEPRVAVRCFWEASRRHPNSQTANYQLVQQLREFHNPDEMAPFRNQLSRLNDLASVLKAVNFDQENDTLIRRAAETLVSHNRLLEARAWYRIALRGSANSNWADDGLRHIQSRLKNTPSEGDRSPFDQLDLSKFPLPQWQGPNPAAVASKTSEVVPPSSAVSFIDQAEAAGLDFSYVNGGRPESTILHMYESTGGGVAVLDFDGDGWPDLYLTQGCRWPPDPKQRTHRDRLFRNTGSGRFEDVSDHTLLGDERFSQGSAIGDFNNDGFPDLYVANIGINRLYRNNGDGTYTEVPDQFDHGDEFWTTSCLMADLNGDGLADLYDVNYLQGSDIFTRVCHGRSGEPGACTPDLFDAAPDQVYLNLGDGRFVARTDAAGIGMANGKGLGILAADIDGTGGLDLFIANDQVPNFYFVNRSHGNVISFDEQAVVRGLGLDGEGRPQACMGIAADDADGDGLLDLFVTNFYSESNTLYLQRPRGLFTDATRAAGLRDPSFSLLGFGTQFLDADLDGRPDLVVSNGHVSNTGRSGTPFRMRPQFFRNVGGGRFVETASGTLGDYFRRRFLGRSLATLDWNRDGHIDFVVSHLDAPLALLTNYTRDAGHFLAVTLCGVVSSRDAIGTSVRVQAGKNTWVKQLTAGDGFQAGNQRQIVFGLGINERIDELSVSWPSGLEQSFHQLSADVEILIIEGKSIVHGRRRPIAVAAGDG